MMTAKPRCGKQGFKAKWVKVILAFLLVLLPLKVYALEKGDKAPDFRVVDLKGRVIAYDNDLKGRKPVYLVFWTTWCPHCARELPQVEKLYKEFGGRIEFLGINLGIRKDIDKFVGDKHISFPVAFDEGDKIAKSFGAQIQTNILIDKQGVIVYKDRGFQEDIGKHLQKLAE